MATIKHFTELKSWQVARELNKMLFQIILNNGDIKDIELKNQLNGSAGSVMDNIAEGFGRGGTRELVQFLGYSLGSLAEVESQLFRSLDRAYLADMQHQELTGFINKLRGMLIAFMNYLKKSDYKGVKYKVEEPQGLYLPADRGSSSKPKTQNPKPKT